METPSKDHPLQERARAGFMRSPSLFLVLLFPLSAWGHGLGLRSRSVAYYSPVAVTCIPVVYRVQVLPICPLPAELPLAAQPPRPAQNYAPPSAAPPSPAPATPPPPLAVPEAPRKPAPPTPKPSSDVRQSSSYYAAYPGTPRETPRPP